jgi:hypothetical protein
MQVSKVSRLITASAATVSYEGNTKVFAAGSPEYEKVKQLVRDNDEQGLIDLLTSFKREVEGAYDGFKVQDDIVYINDEPLPRALGKMILDFAREKLPYEPLKRFWERLLNNPSNTAVQRLFECLEHNNHPLMDDGRFLAWKRVNKDFRDIHTGKFDNSPGTVVEIRRNQVDEDMDVTCSYGLHVASYDYARNKYSSTSDDVLLEVAVDPADVVAIPRDYNSQKMRLCKYEVLRACQEEDKRKLYGADDPVGNECPDCHEDFNDCICDHDEEDDNICPDCGNPYDYCACDMDDDDDEVCPDCGQEWDDCECDKNDLQGA